MPTRQKQTETTGAAAEDEFDAAAPARQIDQDRVENGAAGETDAVDPNPAPAAASKSAPADQEDLFEPTIHRVAVSGQELVVYDDRSEKGRYYGDIVLADWRERLARKADDGALPPVGYRATFVRYGLTDVSAWKEADDYLAARLHPGAA